MSGFFTLLAFLGIFLGTLAVLMHFLGGFGGFTAAMMLLVVYIVGRNSARPGRKNGDGGDLLLDFWRGGHDAGSGDGGGGDGGGGDGGGGGD